LKVSIKCFLIIISICGHSSKKKCFKNQMFTFNIPQKEKKAFLQKSKRCGAGCRISMSRSKESGFDRNTRHEGGSTELQAAVVIRLTLTAS
jgi:hypothetical protein